MIEVIVKREIDKIKIPTNISINVSPKGEIFLKHRNKISTHINITLRPSKKKVYDNLDQSYLDFWYNGRENRIEYINYNLQDTLQGKGYGRKLVEAMENIGKELGCNIIRINISANDEFWTHMNYFKQGEYLEKNLN